MVSRRSERREPSRSRCRPKRRCGPSASARSRMSSSAASVHPVLAHMNRIVASPYQLGRHRRGQRQIDQELQPASGSSRSRTASAAYRSASCTSASSRSGYASTISSAVIPSATIPTIVATGMRRSLMHGTPSIWSARTVIRVNITAASVLPSRASNYVPNSAIRTCANCTEKHSNARI
jgi:hypothetical protein